MGGQDRSWSARTVSADSRKYALTRSLVMGILNRTPDSFYGGSRIGNGTTLLQQAEAMLREGADILDVGGQSTRPHGEDIGEEEELRRVVAAIAEHHNLG